MLSAFRTRPETPAQRKRTTHLPMNALLRSYDVATETTNDGPTALHCPRAAFGVGSLLATLGLRHRELTLPPVPYSGEDPANDTQNHHPTHTDVYWHACHVS